MGNGHRLAPALLVLAMLAALPAGVRAQAQASEQEALRQQQAARMADGYAHLHGFGEGVAAVLTASSPAKRTRVKTYRQPGIELRTMTIGGKPSPDSLTISRAGYPLPLGLHIGDLRGAVEEVLGAPPTNGDTLVLKRSQGEGCDDPITLTFRGKLLSRVDWTWQNCMD